MQQSHVAEFRFPEFGYEIKGNIAQMDTSLLTVCFTDVPAIGDKLRDSTKVDVYFMVKGILRVLGTRLVTLHGQVASLSICEPLRQLHIRKDVRYPVRASIEYRVARGNTFVPVWHKADMQDISLGGLCFDVASHVETPSRVDVAFNLTDMWMQSIWQKDLSGRDLKTLDLSEEMRPFRCQGKVCHARPAEDDKKRLGLQFVAMSPEEKLRLARILNDIFGD